MDPVVLAELDAIDATLAGDPVESEHAELAELALLLQAQRPRPRAEFTAELDRRVERRFAAPARFAGSSRFTAPPRFADPAVGASRAARRRRLGWRSRPLLAGGVFAAALAAAAVAVVLVLAGGGGPGNNRFVRGSEPMATNGTARSEASGVAGSAVSGVAGGPAERASVPATSLPAAPGRKVTQSAQLQLNAASKRVNAVAEELFTVAGSEQAIIEHSSISQGPGSNSASFTLGIPAANLQAALARLTTLRYAHVSSLTNSSSDVTSSYDSIRHRLGDAQALRTSLLKQLEAATTTQATDSLQTQIHDAEGRIASLQAKLKSLNHRVSYSSVDVQVNARPIVPVFHHGRSGHGLTIGRAAHDAVRVLVVAAGVVLIGIAGLIPVALLTALCLWIARGVLRRRREHALDQG